jgi:hypothetical protein
VWADKMADFSRLGKSLGKTSLKEILAIRNA